MEERRAYRGGFVWPLILITAGVVFLLNNLGMVGWEVWNTLLRLWPVLLIAVGLDLLFGRRFPLGSVLLALLLVGAVALALRGGLPQPDTASATVVAQTQKVSQAIEGATSATVEIRFGSGSLNLSALSEANEQLIEGTAELSRGESLRQDFRINEGVGRFALESSGGWISSPTVFVEQGKTWELGLNRELPLDLSVDSGVGRATLDLLNLNLGRFELDGGVGQVTIKLPAAGRYEAQIEGGIGQVIVIIPDGLAARVRVDGGLGGVSAEGDFTRDGDDYFAGDYLNAEDRATVNISGGIGHVIIRALSE